MEDYFDYDYDIPKENIIRAEPTSISLRELFKYDKIAKKYTVFDCRERHNSKLLYRIPEHQRFPQWNKEQKWKLIDTVFRNYTMSGIVLSEKKNIKGIYYDIEDGQTRLSILQDFHACRFKLSNDLTFDDLDLCDQERFLNYRITKEILQNNSSNLNEYDNHIHEMFERLQGGKRLTDDDKYWNRNNTSHVKLAIDIIKKHGNELNIKKFSDKKRKGLTNICGLIGALLYGDNINNFQYSPAFRHQIYNLNKQLSESQIKSVFDFITIYINIKNKVYENIPKWKGEKDIDFKNNTKYVNVVIFDFKENGIKNENMWIDFFQLSRHNKDFSNGICSIYNNLTKANKQNNSSDNIRVRLDRIIQFYRNKEDTSEQHSIIYTNY